MATQSQIDFASELSKKTGADFFTVLGWEAAEGGPVDNPLNIGPGQHFGSTVKAADASASLLLNSGYYKDILAAFQTSYPTETEAIAAESYAIAYNPHWNVIDPRTHSPAEIARERQQYLTNIEGRAITYASQKIKPDTSINPHEVFPGGPQYPKGSGIGLPNLNPFSGIAGAIEAPFAWMGSHWERILFVIGGAIIIIIALILVGNSLKSNTMSFSRGES